jgi:gas vesicle protein
MSKLGDNIKTASNAAKDASATAKRNASAAVEKSKAAASRSVATSKALAKKAGDSTSQTIDKNPLAILAGGLAIGAIAALLIPSTKREQKALGKAGKKITETAKRAVDAAKSAGKEKVDNLGLNQDTLRDQFRDLVNKASEAVKAAGKAAADEARKHD